MIYLVLCILILITTGFAFWNLILWKKLKQTKLSLKELLKEAEELQSDETDNETEIYFKADSEFNITFISESGAKLLGYSCNELQDKPLIGTLLENTPAQIELLNSTLNKMRKDQNTLTSQLSIILSDGQKKLMLCRLRPILNEILECAGISFLCTDISEAYTWKQNLTNFQKTDIVTNTLNEAALLHKFAHDFQLAKRYNREFSCIVIELKDIYEFISKGIDFETADKMLRTVSEVCVKTLPNNAAIGRVDKTKFFIFASGCTKTDAHNLAETILQKSVPAIKNLRVDEYNAQMMVITYANRKNFNDTYDTMLSRVRRHINVALRQRNYGIVSADERNITKIYQ